jgi:5-methylcytosine-specific restriction protein A
VPTRPLTHAQRQAAQRSPEALREARGTAAERGYDHRWRKAREAFLARNPLCLYCLRQGRTAVATLIDHSVPPKGDMVLFWDQTLWVPCCGPCHRLVTIRYDGGHGSPQHARDGHYVSPRPGEIT